MALAIWQNFEHMAKNLTFLGFGVYKIFIVGGTHQPEDFYEQSEMVIKARRLGEWLVE